MPSITIRVDYEPVPGPDGTLPSVLDAAAVIIWHVVPDAVCEDPYAVTITDADLIGVSCPVCEAIIPRGNTVCHACGHTVGVLI